MKESADVGNYAVLFIDILGQSEKLKEYTLVPEEKTENFNKWLHNTIGLVWYFREAFEQSLDRTKELPQMSSMAFSSEELNNIKLSYISDSVILHTPLFTNHSIRAAAIDIYKMLVASANMFFSFLSNGIVFRAGFEAGIGVEDESGKIYGPVVMNSYNLESNIADYPRIVVGRYIVEFLESTLVDTSKIKDKRIAVKVAMEKAYSERILKSLIPITQNEYMLNVFSEEIIGHFAQEQIKPLLKKSYETVIKKIDEYKLHPKIMNKFVLLKQFFDQHEKSWENI